MHSVSSNRRFRPAALVASIALLLAHNSAAAGDFSVTTLTGDADSGINLGLTYTAKADFGGGAQTINGVAFSDNNLTGTGYSLSGPTNPFGGFANNTSGGMNSMVSDFFFGSNAGDGNHSLTLSGLTPGTQYVTSFYNASFGTGSGRYVDITPSDTGTVFRYDEDATNQGNATVLRYAFTATGTTQTFGFDAVNNADTFHHYAMSNAVRNDSIYSYNHFTPVTPTITRVSGSNNPFTVSNTDLLQMNLAGAPVVSGNFDREPITGGASILNNGAFSISGIGNNNPELTTGENNATVTYTLDTTTNTLGYNVTSIAGYGGWNDSGRDRQHYSIFYSTVGRSDFNFLGEVDDDPASPGSLSAVRAVFSGLSISGVDQIRIEILNGQENGYAGYGELDVIGTATVPEPGTMGCLLVGGAALLRRRRRRVGLWG